MTNQDTSKTWRCPLCITHRLPYGTTCKDTVNCGGVLNVNARHYLNEDRTRKELDKAQAIGIGAISNE